MADNNVVGKLSVEIDANPKAAVSGLKTVETAAKQATTTLNATGVAGKAAGENIAAGMKAAEAGATPLIKTFSLVREAFSKVFAPAAIAQSIVSIVRSFGEAQRAAELQRLAIDDLVASYAKLGEVAAKRAALSEDDQSIEAIKQSALKAKQAISDATAKSMSEIRERSAGGMLWALWTGGMTEEEIQKKADDAIGRLDALAGKDLDRERARQRTEAARTEAEAVKQWWINAEKELQEYREKADRDRLDAIKERQAAEEKAAAAAKRNVEDIAKAYGAIESALNSIVKSQQSFANQGQSPVAVGRIAAALEDIARSPRGGAILRGRID